MTAISSLALHHPVVKAAIEALQRGDRTSWMALFEPHATLYDDGQPRDLSAFHQEALGHERFMCIDRVSADGLEVIGPFHSDQWGNFDTCFRFGLSPTGLIQRLDIGQAR